MSTKHRIYLDLDVIFDTRLGTLLRIDEDNIRLLENNKWHTREKDEWRVIDQVTYEQLYADRNNETLKLSPITNILPWIGHYAVSIMAANSTNVEEEQLELIINTYPYSLSTDELADLNDAIKLHTLCPTDILFINKDSIDIGYTFITKNDISLLLIYDYKSFLDNLGNDDILKKKSLADRALFVPDIIHGSIPTMFDNKEVALGTAEDVLSLIIGLKFLPVGHFSSIITFKK